MMMAPARALAKWLEEGESPMPFGFDGSGYGGSYGNAVTKQSGLQCLSAVMGVVTPCDNHKPRLMSASLQCLSAVMGVVT